MSMVLSDFLLSEKNSNIKIVIKDLEQNVLCTTFMSSASSLDSELLDRTINQWFIVSNRIIYIYLDDEVTPEDIPVTGIAISQQTIAIDVGETATLVATIIPENATVQNKAWISTDESIVTVDEGLITAVASGSASIIVTSIDGGYSATCEVTVNQVIIPVTDITLSDTSLDMVVGQEDIILEATVLPEDATDKSIIWSSADENIATVEEGVVHAVAVGSTVITASNSDNTITASCAISITEPIINVTGVSLSSNTLSLLVNDEPVTLVATIEPDNATNKNISWTSSIEDIVTVSEEGVVTPIAEGTAIITVITEDGNFTDTCEVAITNE